jgi:hypothetical protein
MLMACKGVFVSWKYAEVEACDTTHAFLVGVHVLKVPAATTN